MRVYYYPPRPNSGYPNPYSENFRNEISKHHKISNSERFGFFLNSSSLLIHSIFADVFILNWIESVPFYKLGNLQTLIVKIAFFIIKLRKKKLIWIFHNIQPHEGNNSNSDYIRNYCLKNADLIITHSHLAYDYLIKNAEKDKCIFRCHPFRQFDFPTCGSVVEYDVLIWGTITPYKGIVEFLNTITGALDLRIKIIGRCDVPKLRDDISSFSNDRVSIEFRSASFEELKQYIDKSKYVLFPYVGDSVSSSGALIDTISLGGTPLGPNIGGFSDLCKEGMCLTYNNETELISILSSNEKLLDLTNNDYIRDNSWEKFGDFINHHLSQL